MLTIKYENQFRKDYKVIVKRGYDTSLFEKVLEILVAEKELILCLARTVTYSKIYCF